VDEICPKAGNVWMINKPGELLVMPTACKTKGCKVCRKKVESKFKMLVEYGCLTLHPSYFITFTLRVGKEPLRDADYVAALWRKVLENWRSIFGPKVAWLKVVELTKQDQPHLHVIAHFGKKSLVPTCEKKARYDQTWLDKDCDCLEHRFSRLWHSLSADSYVVDVQLVTGRKRASSYLAKYFAKDTAKMDVLKERGFSRAWSRSRTWPGAKMELEWTREWGWTHIVFAGRKESVFPKQGTVQEFLERGEESHLSRRVGDDLSVLLANEAELTYKKSEFRKAVALLDL